MTPPKPTAEEIERARGYAATRWPECDCQACNLASVTLYLLARQPLLEAVARDAAAYARSKHSSYWQQTSASLEALEGFDRAAKGADHG